MRGWARPSERALRLGLALIAGMVLPGLSRASPLTDALAVGACDTATLLGQGPQTDGERLGLARCHATMGQTQQTLALLAPLRTGPLAEHARLVEAEAWLAAGDPSGAANALKPATLTGLAGQRAAALRGRALVEAGRYDEARAVLRPLLEGDLGAAGKLPAAWGADPAEVRWWLAEGAVRRGEPDRAVPVWQSLWARNPTSPLADRAAARLAEAGSAVPDVQTEPGRALVLERVRTLEKLSLYAEALALRDRLPAQTARQEARAAFQARDYPRAAAAFGRVQDRGPEEQFDYALATSRAGDYARAATLYQELYTRFPTHSRGDFASFKVGYLAYDAGELDSAVGLFRDHLARYPSSSHADEARWFIGWSLLRLGKTEDAGRALDELIAKNGGSSLASAGRYWRARIAGMSGAPDKERAGLEALLKSDPASGYAWFAAGKLGKSWPSRPASEPPAAPSALDGEAWRRGRALAEAGMDGWAREELAPLIPGARAAGKDAALALAHALIAAGAYADAQELARPFCTSPWKGGDAVALQACWPRPAASLVSRLAREQGVDANLPYAIMTAESALRPWVTSPVGARGLMQLMPEVAAVAHERRYPGRAFDADALYRPAYNASLGVTELGTLAATFGGRGTEPALPLVIAGYNGGAEAVDRWLKADPRSVQGDWFAENIGFTETRQYVRRVLGYVQTYRYVYGDGSSG